jgi:hypothetical protein
LAPSTLAQLTGLSITDVHYAPLDTEGGYSGSSFWSITIHGEPGVRLVLKRMSLASDYTMWASDDQHGRAVNLWCGGVFDRLPPKN